jgi:FMN phosphatase YigB (HAD superfamily)
MSARNAVTFDLWNTLCYLTPADAIVYENARRELIEATLEDSIVHSGSRVHQTRVDTRTAVRLATEFALHQSMSGRSVSVESQFQHAARLLGCEPSRAPPYAALRELLLRAPIRVTPRALETLAHLRTLGYKIGLVSNAIVEPGANLQELCNCLGLSDYIDHFTFSDQLPWTKPSPLIFKNSYSSLCVDSHHAVHVGDGTVDLLGAHLAGCRAAILYTGVVPLPRFDRMLKNVLMAIASCIPPQGDRSLWTFRGIAGVPKGWAERMVAADAITPNLPDLIPIVCEFIPPIR